MQAAPSRRSSARPWAAAALAAFLVSGCAGGGGADPKAPTEPAIEDLGLVATDTTGVIVGVVVDDAIRPIAGVAIDLGGATARSTVSNDAGAFGFDGLDPGTYFLKASKPGFFDAQVTAEVVAGDPEPPVSKILMRANAATRPFVNVQVFEGFVECTTSVLVLCGAPNLVSTLWCNGDLDPLPPTCLGNVTNDRFTNDFYFVDNASHIQFEMAWQSNQALSPEMYFEMEELNGDCEGPADDGPYKDVSAYNNTHGPTPIYATLNATQVAAWEIGTKCPIYFSVFSGGIPGAPCGDVDPTGSLPAWCVGGTVEQRFKLFVHDFHFFMPAPGWRFVADGPPVVPA
ncbi:MAG: Carboxypeptidase regulatory-like domain [Thermoplasmata archaeon]|jgi:hypothetical protein|nr:Carboxypeptidase regulatory-like domain [Thermoplasmata archaeon]